MGALTGCTYMKAGVVAVVAVQQPIHLDLVQLVWDLVIDPGAAECLELVRLGR
jgi:hypothetical protein